FLPVDDAHLEGLPASLRNRHRWNETHPGGSWPVTTQHHVQAKECPACVAQGHHGGEWRRRKVGPHFAVYVRRGEYSGFGSGFYSGVVSGFWVLANLGPQPRMCDSLRVKSEQQ
ncbi:unnamed protein product, partial [Ixodes pacificus]